MQKSKDLNFDWEDLRYIYHVAKEGSIAAAARKLGVNHSTVFRRVNQFEKRCGTNLFIRNNNGYALSPTGAEVLSYLDKTEQNIQAISLKLMGKEKKLEGNIRITVPGARIESQVIEWIVGFQAIHPNVHFSIDSSIRHADLNRREADIAVRATMTPPEHLVGSELSRMRWGIIASPEFLERHYVPEAFADALRLPWIGYNGEKPSILAELYKRHLPNRSFAIEVDNLEALRYAAQKGLGFGLLPIDDAGENLVTLSFPEVQFESGLWILTHPDLIHAARISEFMRYVLEQMR
jgi:DNA-binding transcriptional LysR family regulator